MDATELTGEERFTVHAETYLRRWSDIGQISAVDINCPGYALTRLYRRTGEPRFLDMVERLADSLHNKIPRSVDPECPVYQPGKG